MKEKDWPGFKIPEFHGGDTPVSLVLVCGIAVGSLFVHWTVSLTLIVTLAGTNAMFTIDTSTVASGAD
jgi:hypothetical protein